MMIRTFERRRHNASSMARQESASAGKGASITTLEPPSAEDIQAWLVDKVAELAGTEADRIDLSEPVAYYGLDSIAAVSLSGELQDWLRRQVPPTLVYDCPSIDAMVRYLSDGG